MATKIFSCLNQGLTTQLVEVEADILQGLASFSIVGLGDTAVQEAKERIRSAIKESGAKYPQQKKIINLAPAHLKKTGPHFDLPMAASLLAASQQINAKNLENALIVGELGLDGAVRAINGALSMAIFARQNNWQKLILPAANIAEARLVKNIQLVPMRNIQDLIKFAQQGVVPQIEEKGTGLQEENKEQELNEQNQVDLQDIKGQEGAARALLIAAAGGHHILLCGPPGIGKTMLAKAFSALLPPLTPSEQMEVMQIYSCAGLFHQLQKTRRPFRRVHSTSTLLSIIGGGSSHHPGEISLAHRGALFLDEIAEFPRSTIEALRQPLETRSITITRTSGGVTYPAQFTLIASTNPCPCGYFDDTRKSCNCRPYQILQYRKKLSGPIRDRIDLILNLKRPPLKSLANQDILTTAQAREQVIKARAIQQQRFQNTSITLNSEIPPQKIEQYCSLDPKSKKFLTHAAEKAALSARQYHQILKIARTIADLETPNPIAAPGEDPAMAAAADPAEAAAPPPETPITLDHILEALKYRAGTNHE